MASLEDLLAQLFRAMTDIQQAGYSQAAAATFLICDLLSCLNDEIEYIWRAKWSVPKVLYLFSRYYSIIDTLIILYYLSGRHSVETCQRYYIFSAIGGQFLLSASVNALFVMRIYALSNRHKPVLWAFVAATVTVFGLQVWTCTLGAVYGSRGVIVPPVPGWKGCVTIIPKKILNTFLISWIANIVISFMFCAYSVYRFGDTLRDHTGKIRYEIFKDKKNISPLLLTVVRDGVAIFFLTLVSSIINTIFSTIENASKSAACLPWLLAIHAYAGCHLVLNVRRAGGTGSPSNVMALSNLKFAPQRGPAQTTQMGEWEGSPEFEFSHPRSGEQDQ